jgi:maltooligosyltrehalose trehalohydrolase
MGSRRFGALVHGAGVRFDVWAPAQSHVWLALEGQAEYPMQPDEDGFFSIDVPDAQPGQRYWYRLAEGLRPDPASCFQPEGPLGPSEVVDHHVFAWTDQHWDGAPPPHGHVLYEMHVGTFTHEGTWAAATERLVSLAEVGITTVEVMPIAEFAGRFGWGYDGVNWFAPSRLYGPPDAVRAFVDHAHRLGLAVILDVVYNHFGPVGNYALEFAPSFKGGPGEWGDSINYDGPGSPHVRAFVCANAAYWIREFHFDGLRLDATQAILDTSDQHVVADICAAARAAAGGRRVFLVGESEPQEVRLLKHAGRYTDGLDAIWSEDWHHAACVRLTGRRRAYFTDYAGTASEFASLVRHNVLYQGQWYSWQKKRRGECANGLPSACFVAYLENHDQVANTGTGIRLYGEAHPASWRAFTALLLLGPSLPMLLQGQEFGSTRPFAYFADHEGDIGESVRAGRLEFLAQFPGLDTPEMRRQVPDPLDESTFNRCKLLDEERRARNAMARLYRDLIRVRRDDPVLSLVGTAAVRVDSSAPTSSVVLVRYVAASGDRLLIVNLGRDYRSPMNDPLLAPPATGEWTVQWSSDAPRYGGSGAVGIRPNGRWVLYASSALLLRAGGDASGSPPVHQTTTTVYSAESVT